MKRCLTLAKELRSRGNSCSFLSRAHAGNFNYLANKERFNLVELKNEINDNPDKRLAHGSWLGVSQAYDLEQTKKVLIKEEPDWLIIDHYSIDKFWEKEMIGFSNRIMIIDDLADREHVSDLLLDQNLLLNMNNRYASKVNKKCELLIGPKYALLDSSYSKLHKNMPKRNSKVKKILTYFGASDNQNLSGMVIDSFISLKRHDIDLDVVVSSKGIHTTSIFKKIIGIDNIQAFQDLPSLLPLLSKADLAIGAGGTTTWERCCLGLPSLVVTVADNQKEIANYLDRLNLIKLLGHKDSVTVELVADAINNSIEDDLSKYSESCKKIVDGKGAARVADRIIDLS